MNKKLIFVTVFLLILLLVFTTGCGRRLAAKRALQEQQTQEIVQDDGSVSGVEDDLGLGGEELDDMLVEEDECDLDAMDQELDALQDL